jgi:hypothetical protein
MTEVKWGQKKMNNRIMSSLNQFLIPWKVKVFFPSGSSTAPK